jgi:hypothetical protein
MISRKWVLDDGLALVRQLHAPLKEAGWAIALGGSVLIKGESLKDLDVLIHPYDTSEPSNVALVHTVLKSCGGTLTRTAAEITAGWRLKGSYDLKYVEAWSFRRRRVDVFYLR